MLVTIFRPDRKSPTGFETPFALQQDLWNDFSFQTQYHLYHRAKNAAEVTFVGTVKIFKLGQVSSDPILLTANFVKLDGNFRSLGQSLDYYERVNGLPSTERDSILRALNDVVRYPELRAGLSEEEGWRRSVLRDITSLEDYYADADAVLTSNFSKLPDLSLTFSFLPQGWNDPIKLSFDAPEPTFYSGPWRYVGPSRQRLLLPRRVAVLIGRNGSGKSTLLSRLARVAFASPSDRQMTHVKDIGQFDPPDIGFTRIITVSYSAFDSFAIPGVYEDDLAQLSRDVEKGEGRFIFCGLRDIVAEVKADLEEVAQRITGSTRKIQLTAKDRRAATKLKSLEQLADEFVQLLHRLETSERMPLFRSALLPLLQDPSFNDLEARSFAELIKGDARAAFLSWSTGHKIAIHVIASVVAHAQRKSIVLFDEPETHLHPPLIAALMHGLRVVLEETNAFAIVATHSPVILQETLARHVWLISREGGNFDIRHPPTETFGENVGILTYDAFGLNAANTDYHEVLDILIESLETLEEIDELFTPHLSSQARAYVMTGLAQKMGPL